MAHSNSGQGIVTRQKGERRVYGPDDKIQQETDIRDGEAQRAGVRETPLSSPMKPSGLTKVLPAGKTRSCGGNKFLLI